MDIQFYHLLSTPLERALPKLVEKAYGAKFRILICAAGDEQAEQLNSLLWGYAPGSFLPHGSKKDGNAERQPIYISAGEGNANQANLLVVTDGSELDGSTSFDRVLDIFDGANDEAVAAARARWKNYQAAGHSLKYIKQTPQGGWEEVKAA